jgi:hypothetical protein
MEIGIFIRAEVVRTYPECACGHDGSCCTGTRASFRDGNFGVAMLPNIGWPEQRWSKLFGDSAGWWSEDPVGCDVSKFLSLYCCSVFL